MFEITLGFEFKYCYGIFGLDIRAKSAAMLSGLAPVLINAIVVKVQITSDVFV